MGQRLRDLGAAEKAVEVPQDQQRRPVRRGQCVDRADGVQRITAAGVGLAALAGDLQALGDVPGGQPPLVLAAQLGEFQQGVIVFVGLDPEAGKAGRDVFA